LLVVAAEAVIVLLLLLLLPLLLLLGCLLGCSCIGVALSLADGADGRGDGPPVLCSVWLVNA
jgi:hypothetical protein